MFYTGPAGTGKSLVLGEIVRLVEEVDDILISYGDGGDENASPTARNRGKTASGPNSFALLPPLPPKKRKVVLTATTGIAACHLGGCTIHSFAGVGTGVGGVEQLAGKVMKSEQAKKRWRECDLLIIDEVSMMEASFFDKLEFIARR